MERFTVKEKQNCVLAKRHSFGMFELAIYIQLLCIFAAKNDSASEECIKYVESFKKITGFFHDFNKTCIRSIYEHIISHRNINIKTKMLIFSLISNVICNVSCFRCSVHCWIGREISCRTSDFTWIRRCKSNFIHLNSSKNRKNCCQRDTQRFKEAATVANRRISSLPAQELFASE